jgi:hypothetical protein
LLGSQRGQRTALQDNVVNAPLGSQGGKLVGSTTPP